MILVSACLLGHKVKYNGGSNDDTLLQAYNAQGRFVAVCPECFAMLPVPRAPMEIQYGTGRKLIEGRARAVDANGHDLTASLLFGVQKILRIAEAYHAEVAIFKEGSPSCGVHRPEGRGSWRRDRAAAPAWADRLLRVRHDRGAAAAVD